MKTPTTRSEASGAERGYRPRFVKALVVVSLTAATVRLLALALTGLEAFEQEWFGYRFSGPTALAAFVPQLMVYLGGAWGLWHRRAWARLGAMVYIGYLLVSFTIWGVRDFQAQGLAWLLLWYAFLLPFCCFSLGFLYREKRYFNQDGALLLR